VNYGYDSTTPLWKEERKQQLVERLVALIHLNDYEATRRPYVTEPYVETDGLYTGVRIRQITNCPADYQRWLTRSADDIYQEVMQ
jgi:hypothetical protein